MTPAGVLVALNLHEAARIAERDWGWIRTATGWRTRDGRQVRFAATRHDLMGLPDGTELFLTSGARQSQVFREAVALVECGRWRRGAIE